MRHSMLGRMEPELPNQMSSLLVEQTTVEVSVKPALGLG
jgi:hypothetical protein